MKLKQLLKRLRACNEAIEWTEENNITTLTEAWAKCERGDWMLWFAGKRSGEPESEKRKVLVLAACECARLALPYAKSPTVLACIETTEKWARGDGEFARVREARSAAAYAAADAAYADAAYAAAYATDADAAAAYDAAAAAYAAAAYAAAAAAAAAGAAAYAAATYAAAAAADDADARNRTLKKCANIIRKHYPKHP
jgi:hypothetical protein